MNLFIPSETPSTQSESIAKCEKQGFRFANWIRDAGRDEEGKFGVAVMIKSKRLGREYREVEPDGTIN